MPRGGREVVSEEGLRQDGRRPGEPRRVECEIGLLKSVDGSASFQQGFTHVISSVLGPRECRFRSKALHDRAIVFCEYSVSGVASNERSRKGDRQGKELALIIRDTFEAAILVDLFPHSEICISIEVLEADGDTLCAAVNATTLALINAGVPMRSFVTACNAGFGDSHALLDLNYHERQQCDGQIALAVHPDTDHICMLRMESKLSVDCVEDVVTLAVEGCHMLHASLKTAVEKYSLSLLNTRGVLSS